MPLTFLDHRLVVGDSLTGPFWERLLTWPGKPDEKLEGVVFRGLENRLRSALFDALRHVKRLEASVGVTLAEVAEKQTAKADLDDALLPFRVAAAAWAGGVMLGPEQCDDVAYAELLQTIATTHELPERLSSVEQRRMGDTARLAADAPAGYATGQNQRWGDTETRSHGESSLSPSPRLPIPASSPANSHLRAMIARGLGVHAVPDDSTALATLVKSGRCASALSYDLTFPEVFYPSGVPYGRHGFDAVLGNPPWEAIQFKSKEFFAAFDFEILNAPTKREREAIERRLTANPACVPLFEEYKREYEEQKRLNDCLYKHQKVFIDGNLAGRQLDAFRVFMERNAQLLAAQGTTGVVVPSAFHANEGATGVRQLYLEKMSLRCCYSFENRRKLFEIHSSFKFALVVATAGAPTIDFACAFYLHDDNWLFGDRADDRLLSYSAEFVKGTSSHLAMLEATSRTTAEIMKGVWSKSLATAVFLEEHGMAFFTAEMHMSHDAWRFVPLTSLIDGKDTFSADTLCQLGAFRHVPLFEGKSFFQYRTALPGGARYAIPLTALSDRPAWLQAVRYFRLSYRNISSSTNERTMVAVLLPPTSVTSEKAPSEKPPIARPNFVALELLGIFNSYAFDFVIRPRIASTVSLFILLGTRLPRLVGLQSRSVAHFALRLTCTSSGYAALWREQLGDAWREPAKQPFTWPVLASDDERWAVRAAIDVVVADAYGLSREQYAHVLSTFSHASYRRAPELCLARFDELKQLGVDEFTRKYDPYWDIPLNENLPQPVIDLPIPGEATDEGQPTTDESAAEFRLTGAPKAKRGRKKR